MNYQDYLSLNYLLVNHKVLQEEFNLSAQKAKKHEEDKQKYDLAQKKWMSKLQVVAGDVEEELNEVKQDNELLVSDNELMQEQLQKLTVENNVLKDQLNLAELHLNYDAIVKIINSSKKEIENNFENQA
jgi:predicted oxidoreductase